MEPHWLGIRIFLDQDLGLGSGSGIREQWLGRTMDCSRILRSPGRVRGSENDQDLPGLGSGSSGIRIRIFLD